jgi:hypothetical protein
MKNPQETRFVYIRNDAKGKPRKSVITAAYRFDDENSRIAFNFAKCSTADSFTKKRGREVAEGRLMLGSKQHPSQYIPYREVSEEGAPNAPRYALIAAAIIHRVNEQL